MNATSKQATVIAVLFVILVGAIVVTALVVYKVDDFLKVWAVIGTLVGVVTGAIPSFFFSRAAASAQAVAEDEGARHAQAEQKTQTLLGLAEPALLTRAREVRPDLFGSQAEDSAPGDGA
jgi:hypothetical protein